MRAPDIIFMSFNWIASLDSVRVQGPNGGWVPARAYGLSNRWKAAWLVFTGKADALVWLGGQ
jgi:hypothetical protein